jgi:hypothetical protein
VNPAVPPPVDPDTAKAINTVIEYGGKAAVSLASIWTFVTLIAKPFLAWRRKRDVERRKLLALEIRDILKPELDQLSKLPTCTERIEIVLMRQAALFQDIDAFLHIASANTDRMDETNDLLDALGFTSDRRVDEDKRHEVQTMLDAVRTRQIERRRAIAEDIVAIHDAHPDAVRKHE